LPVVASTWSNGNSTEAYQANCYLSRWRLSLDPGEVWKNNLILGFSTFRKKKAKT
jgi:hypothetical protein